MHAIPALSVFAGDEACTRRSSSSSIRPRVTAHADRSTASTVLVAGGGAAKLLAEAGACLASSFVGAGAEAIGSELLRRPKGRVIQACKSADVCLCLSLFCAHATKYCIIVHNSEENRTQRRDILAKVRGTKD